MVNVEVIGTQDYESVDSDFSFLVAQVRAHNGVAVMVVDRETNRTKDFNPVFVE